jgi:hypothetical protein
MRARIQVRKNRGCRRGARRKKNSLSGMATFMILQHHRTTMNRRVLLGLAGGLLGIITAGYVIANATSNDVTLAGIQTALFSSLGLMGAAIANKETRFAGYMLISSAVFITMCVPIAGSLALLQLYMPTVIVLGIASIFCFMDAPPEEENPPTPPE